MQFRHSRRKMHVCSMRQMQPETHYDRTEHDVNNGLFKYTVKPTKNNNGIQHELLSGGRYMVIATTSNNNNAA